METSSRPKINGVLDVDSAILSMVDFKAVKISQVMCRPSDTIEVSLPDGFICRHIDSDTDIEQIAKTMVEGYSSGFLYDKYGAKTLEESTTDVKNEFDFKSLSFVMIDAANNQMVGLCLAGISENYPLGYPWISEICVLSHYRGRGIAKYMISQIITQAHGLAPFVKLLVEVGNPAELLYRQMGFIAGPRFTNFERFILK